MEQQSQETPQGHLPSWRCCPNSRPKPTAPWGNPETLRYFLAQYATAFPSWPTPVQATPCPSSGLVQVTQSCATLCHPMDCSPPGSSVQGILQARILMNQFISDQQSSHPRNQKVLVSFIHRKEIELPTFISHDKKFFIYRTTKTAHFQVDIPIMLVFFCINC